MPTDAEPARRRRSRDPAAVRRSLLNVAAEAFQVRGYHSTSTHEIARAAGVTGGAMHHHFPTKKSLGLAVIRDRVAATIEEVWIQPVVAAPTAAEGIDAVFEKIVAGIEADNKVQGCPLNNLSVELSTVDPEFRDALQEVFQKWRSAIEDKLRSDQGSGSGQHTDPHALALFVVAAYSGAMTMAKVAQSPAPLKSCAQQVRQLLATGV